MLFGNTRAKPRNLLAALAPSMDGGNAAGIVATPEQEAESEWAAKRFGMEGVMADDSQPRASAPLPVPGMFGRRAVSASTVKSGDRNPAPRRISEMEADAAQDGMEPAGQSPRWSVEGFDKLRSAIGGPQHQAGGPLGGSMRQPFDYEAALKKLEGEQFKPKWWQIGLATLADALDDDGRNDVSGELIRRRDASRERAAAAQKQILEWQHGDWQNQNEADLRAAAPFSSGRDRVVYDPATGTSHVVYDGPEDFETYAKTMNLEPGTEAYFKAVEDYVLRSNGPSAYDRDVSLDDHRTSNDASLERLRYGNRVGLEGVRQGNRKGMVDYRNSHPAQLRSSGSPRQRIVTVATPAEAMKLAPGTRYKGPDGVVRER